MALIQSLLNENMYGYKCPYIMSPIGIVIHNTYNDASARNEVSYLKSNYNEVSYHVAIDDIEAIQVIPFDRNSWNAGDGGSGEGNRKYIAIEICYSKSGGDRFTKAEQRAVKEVADLCRKYGWGINCIKAHRDFSGKNCPHRTDMNWFRQAVQNELNGVSVNPTPPTPPVSGNVGKYLNLDKNEPSWRVYPLNANPVVGNECGKLAPAQYGGLSYKIEKDFGNGVFQITTSSFGSVKIVGCIGDGGSITSSPVYGGTSTPTPSNKKYLNLHPHVSCWRVYKTSVSPVVGNECGSLAPRQYGGLSYEILEDKGDIKIINTSSFGRVQIFAPRDNDSSITSSPIY